MILVRVILLSLIKSTYQSINLKLINLLFDDVPGNIDDVEISKTIILLAKGLGLDIIAEGV